MTTERSVLRWLGTVAMASLLACTPVAMRGDFDRVAALGGVPTSALAPVLEDDFESEAEAEISRLLEQPLDADAAVRLALVHNRALRARLLELGVARGRLIAARAVANPHVEVELLPERNSDVELALEYELTSLLLAPMRADVARAELEAARLETAAEVVTLAREVRVAFYGLQAAHQQLAIAQRALDAFAAEREAAQAMLEAGNLTPLDAAARMASYERARVSIAALELQVADRRERVQARLGLHGDALGWTPVAQLPAAPTTVPHDDALETRAIRANLDLAAERSRIDAARRRVRLARTDGWVPDIELDVHALHAGAERAAGGEPWGIGGGINLEIPLFDRGRGDIRARRSELAALHQRREGTAVDVRSTARRLRAHLASAHARVRHYEDVIVPAQHEVTEQTLLQYNAMEVGIFAVLQARRDELQVDLEHVETLREYWTARANLDALLAGKAMEPAPGGATRLDDGSSSEGGH